MLRAAGAVLMAAIYLVFTLPYLGIVGLLRKRWPGLGDKASFRMVQAGFRMVKAPCGIKLDTYGLDRVPKDRPVLFVANHRSYLDVILTYSQLPALTGFVAKSDFEKVPILPIWMRRLQCQFLVKDDLRQNLKSILGAIQSVKDGCSIFIFPEGRRSTGEDERDLLPFHEGAFKIAQKTGCPIVPVAICGTRDRFEQHFPKVTGGHVIIEYGEPIETAAFSREDWKGIGERVRGVVQDMVVKNHEGL